MKSRSFFSSASAWVAILVLGGCASSPERHPDFQFIDPGNLPAVNVSANIPGLGPCTDNPDRSLHLNAQAPVNILVHGCYGSSGNFRGMAQVLAFHGQQTACFTYNDRDSMVRSAGELNAALDALGRVMENKAVTVIGHSQGALISRKALTVEHPSPIQNADLDLRLVTVSGPFAGIEAAAPCGNRVTQILSLGLVGLSCQIVTGDKWREITYSSNFIRQPGGLHKQVARYLKIDTDERDTCRSFEDGRCVKSDDVFSLAEQQNQKISDDPLTQIVEVQAGHVEIVGDKRVAPVKLISVLQTEGVLNPTEPNRMAAFGRLLARLYGAGE